jgi:hypothetical protein
MVGDWLATLDAVTAAAGSRLRCAVSASTEMAVNAWREFVGRHVGD